jgi:hypothetical protein
MKLFRIGMCVLALCLAATAQVKPAAPCSLLTAADIQQVAGGAVTEGTPNKLNPSVCDYKMAAGSILNVTVTPKGPADTAEKMVSELKKRNITAEVVAGIGDSSYASSPGYGMQQAGAYKGSNHVIVTILLAGAPEAKARTTAQTLLKKALTKVP